MHNKINSSKSVKSQLFLLANLFVIHSSADGKERKEALKLAADIVFYDDGYRSVRGISELSGTWSKSLEATFKFGSNTHPFKTQHKSSLAYTTQLEAKHPGCMYP